LCAPTHLDGIMGARPTTAREFSMRISTLLAAGLVLVSGLAAAEETGRYQMIALPRASNESATSVMILDTRDGHLWQWQSEPSGGPTPGGYSLLYQGKVKPGKEVGEVIEKRQR
jgi:hypothetical protein